MQAVAAVTITYTQTTYTVTQTRAVTAPVATTTENGEPILWRLNGRGGADFFFLLVYRVVTQTV